MAAYRLGNYSFDSQIEYERAKKEYDFIQRAREKYDIYDPHIAEKILDKFKPQTIVGRDFCALLRDTCSNRATSLRSPNTSMDDSSSRMVMHDPDKIEILRRLKKYNKTFECTCLECGYKGPMGVISDGHKGRTILTYIIVFVIFTLFVPKIYQGLTIGGIVIAAILIGVVGTKLKANQKTLYCPNCEKTLYTK